MSTRDRMQTHNIRIHYLCSHDTTLDTTGPFVKPLEGYTPKRNKKLSGTQDSTIPIFNNLSVVVRRICSGLFAKTSVYDDSRTGGSIKSGSLLKTQREQGGDSFTIEQTE